MMSCPFCGSYDVDTETDDDIWLVFCGSCGAGGPMRETRQEAAAAWNNRFGGD